MTTPKRGGMNKPYKGIKKRAFPKHLGKALFFMF